MLPCACGLIAVCTAGCCGQATWKANGSRRSLLSPQLKKGARLKKATSSQQVASLTSTAGPLAVSVGREAQQVGFSGFAALQQEVVSAGSSPWQCASSQHKCSVSGSSPIERLPLTSNIHAKTIRRTIQRYNPECKRCLAFNAAFFAVFACFFLCGLRVNLFDQSFTQSAQRHTGCDFSAVFACFSLCGLCVNLFKGLFHAKRAKTALL